MDAIFSEFAAADASEQGYALATLEALVAEPQMLTFALELENGLIKEYVEAFGKLTDAELLKTTAQIMSNEGQHLVMLRLALGADPVALVPSAFETGSDPAPQAGFFGP